MIRREMKLRGPISFERFMELALYHPRHGYYASGRARIGRRGDFYTSVSIGALFGELLARQFAEMWEALNRPKVFSLIEAGAHDGQLATDILGWLRENRTDAYLATRYIIVEPSPALQKLQLEKLLNFQRLTRPRIRWMRGLREIRHKSIVGCLFCNELLDAFPVRRITLTKGKWHEACVSLFCHPEPRTRCAPRDEGSLQFTPGPVLRETETPEIFRFAQNDKSDFPDGYTTEICPTAAKWVQTAARKLRCGWILIFDYGYEAEEYYAPHRTDGTLLCYYQHRTNQEPLLRVGQQDITAHVNFTALARAAEAAGAQVAGFTDQEHFVVGAAKEILTTMPALSLAEGDAKKIRALQTLMHPEHLGRAMKLLALQKCKSLPKLSGLAYARKL